MTRIPLVRLGSLLACAALLALLPPAPAHAAVGPVHVMTWNACGNDPKPAAGAPDPCTNSRNTTNTAGTISWHMKNHYVDGSLVVVDAVLLQEVCEADVARLRTFDWLAGWSWAFAPITQRMAGTQAVAPKVCRPDDDTGASRGYFGVAIGVDRATTFRAPYYYRAHPSGTDQWGNDYQHRVLLCGTVSAWSATICDTHLSPVQDNDADGSVRAAQVREMLAQAGTGRVLVGGDLNTVPPDSPTGAGDASPLAPLYTAYDEADGSRYADRDGEGTFQQPDGGRLKLDYLFTTRGATQTCDVTDNAVLSSDHRPLVDVVTW
ncbi:endonuclease/exonuclease/phosphatase family protein [Actinocatenispora rupis]|uniref:Endonuclease/exonuclease/phosphatase domain-containing protein n=1 Tax=Actinocatenispora rupis TaxID=519421 RepID=A0A8J3JAF0_9ACTN|nr:endonuclease/exonuclease/phosphatase family protein [Actinocatenispora rupis]GID14701.1 hypothetical protein Aru02nite_55900 [Actinocatenispora rupis]